MPQQTSWFRLPSFMPSSDVPSVSVETSHTSFGSLSSDYEFDLLSFEVVDRSQPLHSRDTCSPSRSQVLPFTGASHYRWGAPLERMRLSFHGCWTEDQSQLLISSLEIMANFFALKKAIHYIQHSCVMISTNNTTVVSYVNKQGGIHSANLYIQVWEI